MPVFWLPWREVDPEGRPPPDPVAVRDAALAVMRAVPRPWEPHVTWTIARSVSVRLVADFGPWTFGWEWAQSDGGPVSSWCCLAHSLKGSTEECAERVVRALLEWDAWLRSLGEKFLLLRERSAGLDELDGMANAAEALLSLVLEHTGVEDAWYRTYDQVLSWYAYSAIPGIVGVEALVEAVTRTCFSSWISPDARRGREAAEAVAIEIACAPTAPFAEDALQAWWTTREATPWEMRAQEHHTPVLRDGHAAYIRRRDAARSKERATRMSLALDAARSSARQGLPLDLTRLASWQRVVLDVELAPLRRSDAHAKGGRERYGTPADLRALAEACLADALEPGVSPIVRAVRLYLDICFLHPFADGNARSARLALDYVLSREGLALHSAEVLFGLPRWAHDPGMPYEMMQALAYLVGER